jgi:hypothetical protein
MSMYCGGHGLTLPCAQCAKNLRDAPAWRIFNELGDLSDPDWDELSHREREDWRQLAATMAENESATPPMLCGVLKRPCHRRSCNSRGRCKLEGVETA